VSESTSGPQGPGKVLIWLLLLILLIGIGIGVYFLGPLLQEEVISEQGTDQDTPESALVN
jgi:hypothetical protein